jgi:hypothetical protein
MKIPALLACAIRIFSFCVASFKVVKASKAEIFMTQNHQQFHEKMPALLASEVGIISVGVTSLKEAKASKTGIFLALNHW